MEYIALGRSNLLVSHIAFGGYGLQYLDNIEDSTNLVKVAYESGINFFDTARSKPESEKRLQSYPSKEDFKKHSQNKLYFFADEDLVLVKKD